MENHKNGTLPLHGGMEHAKPEYVDAAPGEIICTFCGKPIIESELPEDPQRKKLLLKWECHDKCEKKAQEKLDEASGEGHRHQERFYQPTIDKGSFATEKF